MNIATLAVLATLLVGIGRQSVALPLCTLFAALASLWLTDITGRFRLGAEAINVAVVATAAVAIWRIGQYRWTIHLAIVADALVCVQIILFFEEKSLRTWWDLIALSLLQVFVAASLFQGPLFGLVLAAYVFFGVSALALMLLYREQTSCGEGCDRASRGAAAGDKPPPSSHPAAVDWRRLAKIALATLAVGPLSLFLRYRERARSVLEKGDPAASLPCSKQRWPARGHQPVLAGSPEPWSDPLAVGREFWGRVTGMALTSVLVSLVVFCAVPRFRRLELTFPRFGPVAWRNSDLSPRRSVGFSDRVTLGELGMLIDNPEQVLQVRFLDHQTDGRYTVQGEVYLRGAVLDRYEAGQWEHQKVAAEQRFHRLEPGDAPPDGELVRQEITIEPMDREELFCVWPFVATKDDPQLQFDAHRERLRRPGAMRERRFSFELGTTAFVDGIQTALVPCRKAVDREALLPWPSHSLPGLKALADEWVADSGLPESDPLSRARFLEGELRDSRRFEYSLQGRLRDAALDPIEDFVVNNPQGHCEYFATALTLMLRSQGIPARLVVGYKCDEYGYLSQAYRVRQSHAHTWVEAYVAASELPTDSPETSPFMDWSRGGWLRLDPTPIDARGGAVVGRVVKEVENWFQWVRSAWARDVLGMDSFRQRALIYGPVTDWMKQAVRNALDPGWWRRALLSAGRALFAWPGTMLNGWPLGWRVGLPAVVVVCGLVLSCYGFGLLLQRLRPFPGLGPARARSARPKVAFYRRLEAVLARYGLRRPVWQTQREFARQAGAKLAESTGQLQLIDLPARIAEAFYQVRFGGLALDRQQAAAVDQALRRLELATNGRSGEDRRRSAPTGQVTSREGV